MIVYTCSCTHNMTEACFRNSTTCAFAGSSTGAIKKVIHNWYSSYLNWSYLFCEYSIIDLLLWDILGASESEREEGINHRGAIVIPKSPEICDVMSPTVSCFFFSLLFMKCRKAVRFDCILFPFLFFLLGSTRIYQIELIVMCERDVASNDPVP